MGFKVPRRQARVTFEEGHDYHGAEVVLNLDLPTAAIFELQRLQATDGDAAVRMFADDALVSWNVEDEAGPVPASYEGAKTQPSAFILALMQKWMEAATDIPAPLGQASSATDGSVVPLASTGSA